MLISFIMVPITLSYLDKTRYGLWAALSSFLSWFFIFDIGIGQGLRNRFIELKAKGEIEKIKSYVSTAYFLFSVVVLFIMSAFLIARKYINWGKLLNAPSAMNHELLVVVSIVFTTMCFSFLLKLINTILQADLKSAVSDSLAMVSHLLCLLGIIFLSKFTKPSLLYYAILFTGSNLFVTLTASIVLYTTKFRCYSPSFRSINLSYRHDLLNTGFKFFLVQIVELVLFQTTSFILINLTSPAEVTVYSINMKYFTLGSVVFVMMSQPLWTGYGMAYASGKILWITQTIKKLKKLWLVMCGILLMMLVMQPIVFKLWLKGRIEVDFFLSSLFVIYLSINMWNGIHNPFINATSKLKPQLYASIVTVPVFLGLVVLFVKTLNFGPPGMLMALILAQAIPVAFILTLQSKHIIRNYSFEYPIIDKPSDLAATYSLEEGI